MLFFFFLTKMFFFFEFSEKMLKLFSMNATVKNFRIFFTVNFIEKKFDIFSENSKKKVFLPQQKKGTKSQYFSIFKSFCRIHKRLYHQNFRNLSYFKKRREKSYFVFFTEKTPDFDFVFFQYFA